MGRVPTSRVRQRESTTEAASEDRRFRAHRVPASRADIRPQAVDRTSLARGPAARKFRGRRLPTRRTIADMVMARPTGLNRTTVRMAHTTVRATAGATVVRHQATAVPTRVITVRLRATAVRAMAAEATAVLVRVTAADRTAGRRQAITVDR